MPLPKLDTVPPFFHNYLKQVQSDSLDAALEGRFMELFQLLKNCPDANWNLAYAPQKWTLKEVVQHLIDTERIMSYRALCIARGEPLALPGFDENLYAANSLANERTAHSLLQELEALNTSTNAQFQSFTEAKLQARGISNNAPISVNAIGYIIAGHALHHTKIIRERYQLL